MAHYTRAFLEAYQRLQDKIKAGADPKSQFIYEMRQLGWKERIKNLYRIKDKKTGKFIFFVPNRGQSEFQEERDGRDIILKSRQIGFSTWSCIYAYDRSLFDDWSTGVMSHIREKTSLIFEIIKNANDWFKKDWGKYWTPEQEQDSANRILWKDSKASITVAYDFRSLTTQFLHVSEAAFIESARLTGSLQSVPEGGEVILESTAQGCGGFFYNQWQLWRKQGTQAPYRGHFYPWFEHYPENVERWIEKAQGMRLTPVEEELKENFKLENYHLAWRRWKIDESCEGEETKFEEEYPSDDISCFLSGMNQVFSTTILKKQESFITQAAFVGMLKADGKRVSFLEDKKGLLEIWEKPKAGVSYCVGVDIAEGRNKDFSVAFVLNKNTGEQVAMLRGQIQPEDYWEELWRLGHYYNYAYICPEINMQAGVVTDLLKNGYSKIYKREEMDDFTKKKVKKYGFRTTSSSKPTLIKNFASAAREGKFKARSQVFLEEASSFIQIASATGKSLRMEARAECHDDTVIAAALAWEMCLVLQNEINDKEIAIPENLMYDSDTGFIVPRENLEGNYYG